MSEENNKKISKPDFGEDHIIKDLRYCSTFLHNHSEGKGSQRRVLFTLHMHGPMTQKDLLDIMGVRASSMSELLSKLETKGYVQKKKSEVDKRNYNVFITDEGLGALTEMQAQHQAAMSELLSGLSSDERTQLAALLSKLRTLWSNRDDSPPTCPGKR